MDCTLQDLSPQDNSGPLTPVENPQTETLSVYYHDHSTLNNSDSDTFYPHPLVYHHK